MINDIITTKAAQELISDKTLAKYTYQIMNLGINIRKSMLKVASLLSSIDEKELYAREGFSSTAEYSERILGIKKSQANNMVRVGKLFVDGKTRESILPHGDRSDYNLTQLVVLLPLKSAEKALELANDGIISPDMTVQQIKDAIEPYKPAKALASGDSEGESDTESTTVHADASDVAEIAYERIEAITIERKPSGEYVAFLDDVSITIDELLAHIAQYK